MTMILKAKEMVGSVAIQWAFLGWMTAWESGKLGDQQNAHKILDFYTYQRRFVYIFIIF